MNTLRIAENIVQFRKKKGVTQDEMASFLGVTKASVSKWENGQSMPDIMMLPQLATYFDVTVDDLIGYEPQLAKEQIQKIYRDLCKDFAEKPFEEAYEKSESLVKQYYSCYLFLFQICVLWLNHVMLAEGQERQMEVIHRIVDLCDRILENCKSVEICNDAIMMKALANLQCGKAQEAIDGIEELVNPYRLANQSDSLLIEAYRMTNQVEKADSFAQMSMYLHLLLLIGDGIQFLGIHMQEREICDETIRRLEQVIDLYHMDKIHPNVVASYLCQAAAYFCIHGEFEAAIKRLQRYVRIIIIATDKEMFLCGDDYFTKLDGWFENLDLGTQMVRDKKLVLQSARMGLENPVFAPLRDMEEFAKICGQLE